MAEFFKVHSQLSQLKTRQADLENQISRMTSFSLYDQLAVQRLKRQTSQLKEKIQLIQSTLRPDIIA